MEKFADLATEHHALDRLMASAADEDKKRSRSRNK